MENPRPEKVAVVDEVRERLRRPPAPRCSPSTAGSTCPRSAELRRALRAVGGEYKIYKNTLVRFAARDLGLELDDLLTGPTAIAFVRRRCRRSVTWPRRCATSPGPTRTSSSRAACSAEGPHAPTRPGPWPTCEPREVLLAQLAGALAAPHAAVRRPAPGAAPQLRLRPQGPHRPAGGVPERALRPPRPPCRGPAAAEAPEAEADDARGRGCDRGPRGGRRRATPRPRRPAAEADATDERRPPRDDAPPRTRPADTADGGADHGHQGRDPRLHRRA